MRNKTTRKSAFTLVETIITVVIMSLLIGMVFEIFSVISHIAVYTQYQKYVHNEIVFVMQTMQNLVDDQNMVLSITGNSLGAGTLSNGMRNNITFTDGSETFFISKKPDACTDNCYLNLRIRPEPFNPVVDTEENVPLTSTELVDVTKFLIKVLPYDPESSFETKLHEGFRMFLSVEIPEYDETAWRFRVKYDLQSFFTVRKY